jgi:hypothetical protein
MCLIIVGKADKLKSTLLNTNGMLEDIYRSNPDGIGIMYASRRGLRIFKRLPKTVAQARHFLARMPGDERNLAVHFRWTTHGNTDKLNCHPYTVVEGECALMHNGVLHTGNNNDRSKSDTWHFIKDYLEGAVKLAPQIVHDAGFKALVKDYIRMSNRFVFMTRDGTMSIINSKEGIEHDGLWFSNTYAWRPAVLIPNHNSGYNYRSRGGYGGVYGYGDDEYGYGSYQGGAQSGNTKSEPTHTNGVTRATRFAHRDQEVAGAGAKGAEGGAGYTAADEQEADKWREVVQRTQANRWPNSGSSGGPAPTPASGGSPAVHTGGTDRDGQRAVQKEAEQGGSAAEEGFPTIVTLAETLLNADIDQMEQWLEAYPTTTVHMLFNRWKPSPTRFCDPASLDGYSRFIYDACINEDRKLLVAECQRIDASHAIVAEVIQYYLNWTTRLVEKPAKAPAAAPTPGRNARWLPKTQAITVYLGETYIDRMGRKWTVAGRMLVSGVSKFYAYCIEGDARGARVEYQSNGVAIGRSMDYDFVLVAPDEPSSATPNWPFPTTVRHGGLPGAGEDSGKTVLPETSTAQLGQGGDGGGEDGYAERSLPLI